MGKILAFRVSKADYDFVNDLAEARRTTKQELLLAMLKCELDQVSKKGTPGTFSMKKVGLFRR